MAWYLVTMYSRPVFGKIALFCIWCSPASLYGEIEILPLASWPKAIVPSLMGVSLARLLLNLFQSAKQLHILIHASKHNYVLRWYKHRKEMDEIVIWLVHSCNVIAMKNGAGHPLFCFTSDFCIFKFNIYAVLNCTGLALCAFFFLLFLFGTKEFFPIPMFFLWKWTNFYEIPSQFQLISFSVF